MVLAIVMQVRHGRARHMRRRAVDIVGRACVRPVLLIGLAFRE